MLEFVDSGLYFFQDENDFINPLLQVGSGSVEKSTGSSSLIPCIKKLEIEIECLPCILRAHGA